MSQNNKNQPKKFIKKMYEILENQKYFNIISWDEQGICIIIKNSIQFEQQVIPSNFRLKKMSSFIRQLHLYNFHKIKSNQYNLMFKNDIFTKENKNQLKYIARKRLQKTTKCLSTLQSNQKTQIQSFQQHKIYNKEENNLQNQKEENLFISKGIIDYFQLQFPDNKYVGEIISGTSFLDLTY